MEKLFHKKKTITNSRDFNSKYWQDYKKTLPALPPHLREIAVGMILGDAGMHRVSREASIKFEQGKIQRDFVFHLFECFRTSCFMSKPGERLCKKSTLVKSSCFKTFSHPEFTHLYTLFYTKQQNGK